MQGGASLEASRRPNRPTEKGKTRPPRKGGKKTLGDRVQELREKKKRIGKEIRAAEKYQEKLEEVRPRVEEEIREWRALAASVQQDIHRVSRVLGEDKRPTFVDMTQDE